MLGKEAASLFFLKTLCHLLICFFLLKLDLLTRGVNASRGEHPRLLSTSSSLFFFYFFQGRLKVQPFDARRECFTRRTPPVTQLTSTLSSHIFLYALLFCLRRHTPFDARCECFTRRTPPVTQSVTDPIQCFSLFFLQRELPKRKELLKPAKTAN